MKKLILMTLLLSVFTDLIAQKDTTNQIFNKKGISILPEKGDWVIGIDAVPFLEYIGNIALVSNTSNDSPDFTFTAQRPGQIFGKYYVKDNKAIRAALRIGFSSHTDKDGNPFDADEIDKLKENSLNIGLAIGIENHRRIRGRLRGFWGYEAGLQKTPYLGTNYFGNSTVSGKVAFEDGVDSDNNYTEKGGNTYGIYARGLIGVEFFIAPKISLSGEFGLGLGYQFTTERKYEPDFGTSIISDAGSSEFFVDNTASGALVLLFHF